MTVKLKLHLLLFLLTLVSALTAVTIHRTFDNQDILISEAQTLEKNLQQKERFVQKFLNDSINFEALKTLGKNEEWTRTFIPEFEKKP